MMIYARFGLGCLVTVILSSWLSENGAWKIVSYDIEEP